MHGNYTVKGAPSWSPDGQRSPIAASPTTLLRETRTDAYVVNLADQARRDDLGEVRRAVARRRGRPTDKTLAYTTLPQSHSARADSISDVQIGNNHLMLYDVATARHQGRLRRQGGRLRRNADVERGRKADSVHDGRARVQRGVRVRRRERQADARRRQAAGARHLGVERRTHRRVRDGHAERAGRHLRQRSDIHVAAKLTDVNPQVRDLALGETEIVTWKSSDGTPVEGILLKPVGYQPGRRYPLLVEAHGGPTGATNAGFKANWGSPGQVWAGEGWAMLYPNPRGSTGYGEKFTRANIMDWGGGDYRDIMTGVDEMIKRGIADSTKLAFEGWSYGGYMTAWVVSQTSRFKAARMGAGLSDLQSMYGTTDIPGYIGTFFSGTPTQKTLDFYRARSAITFVDQVTTPLLILHGGSDERVPVGQSMEYFRALKDRGKPVQLVFYPREGHGLGEYYHQLDKMQRENDWITKYTLGDDASRYRDVTGCYG